MNLRQGDLQRPHVAMDHAAHEAEKTALRLRIVVLEAEVERKTEALERLLQIWNQLHDGETL